ncbi:MAG: hypothetical protein NUV99_04285 [Clostridia bacterium]|jgi:hypothetical protein|nr:hypothetical protein [Clostridia bacterium]
MVRNEIHRQTEELVTSLTLYLPRLTEALLRAASSIQEGREAEGLSLVAEMTEGFGWVTESLDVLHQAWGEAAPEAHMHVAALNERLSQALAAVETYDLVLLADVLQYELAPEVEAIETWLSGLRQIN